MGVKSFNAGVLFCTAMLSLPLASFAQTGEAAATAKYAVPKQSISPVTGKVETQKERMDRLGTESDPGFDPDPNKHWFRYGKEYIIEKYEKKWAAYDVAKGHVRPRADINVDREIYQETDEYVWVWSRVPGSPDTVQSDATPKTPRKYTDEDLKWIKQIIPDMKELDVPSSSVTLKFRESSKGLPTGGSWRNSMGVGDFNEDGKLDLIVPPPRGSIDSVPLIFLGDGAGNWKEWKEASFPIASNYGSAEVGDFNGDHHLDVVIGVHLFGVQVFLGNGKGYFVDGSKGLPHDFPTRRAIVRDFNHDGKLDIAALSEGPSLNDRNNPNPVETPKLRVFFNDGKSNWTEQSVAEVGRQLGGDWLASGDFDGNKQIDLAAASNYYNSPDTIYLNQGKKWTAFGRGWMPFYTYYGALVANHFTSATRDDIVLSYVRIYPTSLPSSVLQQPEIKEIAGLERVSWGPKGPVRTPIVRWGSRKAVWSMGTGDFDGDGNQDVAFGRIAPRQYVFLLGDGKGGFTKARLQGIDVPENTTYDIKVADVNQDGRPDILLMYESEEGKSNGSIHVYLNETGPVRAKKGK